MHDMRTKLEDGLLAAEQDVRNIFQLLLRDEFGYESNSDSHPRAIYMQLYQERERFIDHCKLFSYDGHKTVASDKSFGFFSKIPKKSALSLEGTERQAYEQLLNDPNVFDKKDITDLISILLDINASLTIKLIYTKYPDLIDSSQSTTLSY